MKILRASFSLISVFALSACTMKLNRAIQPIATSAQNIVTQRSLEQSEETPEQRNLTGIKHIIILATNDIHGSIDEQEQTENKQKIGGMPMWSGIIQATKVGIKKQFGDKDTGVLTLDAGDQFQGTLLSNYSEGKTVIDSFSMAGYDAVVPGNHDYDFGPLGWLDDKVSKNTSQNTREVIEELSKRAQFAFLSANTYLKDSLVDVGGHPVDAESIRCKPKNKNDLVEFSFAQQPSFLKPYIIKNIAGVRVAVIGLDNPETPSITTVENVSDLCFRDEAETYFEIRKSLENKADVFIIAIHNGDVAGDERLTAILRTVTQDADLAPDAVIGGHTHQINHVVIENVPAIQSGANGKLFGRIDLFYDADQKRVLRSETKSFAGVKILNNGCDDKAKDFCVELTSSSSVRGVLYEKEKVEKDANIVSLIEAAKSDIAPIADRILGQAIEKIKKSRTDESALMNIFSDELKLVSNADIAFVNAGGIRDDLDSGPVTYEELFKILPFNNHAVRAQDVPFTLLYEAISKTVKSCGAEGVIVPSGLKITFNRDCKDTSRTSSGIDNKAKVLSIVDDKGIVLVKDSTLTKEGSIRAYSIATLDFIMSGGAGFTMFKSIKNADDIGNFREIMANDFEKAKPNFSNKIDGRFKEIH